MTPLPKAKILIVDDDSAVVDMLEKFFSRRGYQTVSTQNSSQVVDEVKKNQPSVVLLDVFMPGKNGLMVLAEIRRRCPDVGVIMVTAVDHEDIEAKALKLGAAGYVRKPFDLDYLEKVVLQKIRGFGQNG